MREIILGVVGKNIGYSKSPLIHSEFGKSQGIPINYTIEDVGEGAFEAKIVEMQARGFLGCNITVPYKENAFAMAHEKTSRAEKAKAANTFLFKDGRIYADNTDGAGLIRDITNNIGYSIAKKRIVIYGAGGAIRGILSPLMENMPASITIANRTLAKGIALSKEFSTHSLEIKASTYDTLAGETFDLVIDGTSLKTEALPIPTSVTLSEDSLVYDLKYNPDMETSTMAWGKSKGAEVHDGIGMLVEQAAEAFKMWTGREPATQPVIVLLQCANSMKCQNPTVHLN